MIRPVFLALAVLAGGLTLGAVPPVAGQPTHPPPELRPDSLHGALRQATADTTRARLLLRLSNWYQDRDTGRTRQYAQRALRMARRAGSRPLVAEAYLWLGANCSASHHNEAALRFLRPALALFTTLDQPVQMARCHRGIAHVMLDMERPAAARLEYWAELRLHRRTGNRKKMAEVYANLGGSYQYTGASASLRYLLKSLSLAEEQNHAVVLVSVLRSLGSFYDVEHDYKRALGYLNRELQVWQQLNSPDGIGGAHVMLGIVYGENQQDRLSMQHLLTGRAMLEHNPASRRGANMATALAGLGEMAAKKGNQAQAVRYLQPAAAMYHELRMPVQHANVLNELATIYLGQGRVDAARQAGEVALRVAAGYASPLTDTYAALARISAATHDYAAAYAYQQHFQTLNDSLFNQAKSQQLASLSTRFETQKKEAQITLLQGNAALQRRARNLLVGGLVLVALMGAGTYWRYYLERRARRQLQAKELELAARNRMLTSTEQRLHQSLDEKEVLLKEVHHRVKNNLQVIASRLALQALAQRAQPTVAAALRDGQNWVKSISLIHEMLYQSEDLASVAFQPFLEQLVAHLGRTFAGAGAGEVVCAVHAPGILLGTSTAVPVGLVVNELLSNAYKHAFAGGRNGRVDICLTAAASGDYCLRVRDDGAGLPPDFTLETTSSLGLRLARSLARQLEGSLAVGPPATGLGTEFCLSFRAQAEPSLPVA